MTLFTYLFDPVLHFGLKETVSIFAGAAPLSTSTIYKALLWFGSSLFEKEDADPSDDWEQMASKLTVRVQINIFSSHFSQFINFREHDMTDD